jgi:hypothetical protein
MILILTKTMCKFFPGAEKILKIGKRTGVDRRSTDNRRRVFDKSYFATQGVEKRHKKERRQSPERRTEWVRVSNWKSVLKI